MGQITETEQVCINCKGSRKKLSLFSIIFAPIQMLILIPIVNAVFSFELKEPLGPLIFTIDFFIVLLIIWRMKRKCPTCNGRGKVINRTTIIDMTS